VNVPLSVVKNDNVEQQFYNEPMIQNDYIVEEPQKVALRRSQKRKKICYFK